MEKRFLLVDAAVLPEVFVRVLQAKELRTQHFGCGENGRAFAQRLLQV